MPDLPWRRRRGGAQRDRAAQARAAGGKPPREPSAPPGPASGEPQDSGQLDGTHAGYLRRAVDCYLRAGQVAEAACCLSRLGEHHEAALLFARTGDYAAAARSYADQGDIEAAAWTHVHHLSDPATARALLDEATPAAGGHPGRAARSRETAEIWRPRLREVDERAAELPAEGAVSVSGREALAKVMSELRAEVPGEALARAMMATLRPIKLTMVEAGDWQAAYTARTLERLLTELAAARAMAARATVQGRRERAATALARRQVAARCDIAEQTATDRALRVLAETQAALADVANAEVPERAETWGVAIAQAMRRYDQAALVFAAAVRGGRPGASARWRAWSVRVLHADAALSGAEEVA